MKHAILFVTLILSSLNGYNQTVQDLFTSSDVKISYLGVDFSHVKLIGDFSQFEDAGQKSSVQIRDKYFPGWNKLILSEPDKYDIKGMLRKGEIFNDLDMVMDKNAEAGLEDMEAYNNPNYSKEDIEKYISEYKFSDNNGIGIIFIAECLDKNSQEAYFHFVAINKESKELLIHERLRGEPRGFGLKNYWAGAIYDVIKSIRNVHYKKWKRRYSN